MNDNLYLKIQLDAFIEQHPEYGYNPDHLIEDLNCCFIQKSEILGYISFTSWCDKNNIETNGFRKYGDTINNYTYLWISPKYFNLFIVSFGNSDTTYVLFSCNDGTEVLSVLDDI